MSNKEWDIKSYNESYWAEMDKVQAKWKEMLIDRPIEDVVYQPVTSESVTSPIRGSDIY